VEADVAQKLNEIFVELVFAPGYTEEALEILTQKPNIRILEDQERRTEPIVEHDIRRVRGGILVQDRDEDLESRDEMHVVTERAPTEREWGELLFAWKVCKHVRSNAIVLAKNLATVGIGAGQMSRVDSVELAVRKARRSLDGAAMASDAFFPFADGPQAAIEAGVRAIIQPGGSKRDEEVIAACNEANVAMVFTSRRHFRH
jgi:phosphoribosylaminoimidazolecarboxamide formyltransferase/IMP cyclohydrolase